MKHADVPRSRDGSPMWAITAEAQSHYSPSLPQHVAASKAVVALYPRKVHAPRHGKTPRPGLKRSRNEAAPHRTAR